MIVSSSCTVHPKPTSGAEEDSMSTRIAAELEELPPTISVERAARLLGLSRSAAYRAAATGQLPTLAFSRRRLVPTFRLMQMLGIPEEAPR
jgi:hypothetical protein